MGEKEPKKTKKQICMGLLAHVDAGKTTLSEAMLYTGGMIRKPGRVDHQNAFLDTFQLEKSRGITIFSKQAELNYDDMRIMLLDTPGHMDFSAEMERTLQVLDYAVLVISGKDGVQGHTGTLYRLLKKYKIPTFAFINKMDLEGTNREKLLAELQSVLDPGFVDFSGEKGDAFAEQLAMCDENLLEHYLETGNIEKKDIVRSVKEQKIYPCYFGSALKMEGVKAFMEGLAEYTESPAYPQEFGARVYKIARDHQGKRLTYLKVTGGSLAVKDLLGSQNSPGAEEERWEEKVDQIRIYSGAKFRTADRAAAGEVCAVTGLSKTFPGQGLGIEKENLCPVLEPVLIYSMILPEDRDVHAAFLKLKELEEEDPLLKIIWNEQLEEIHLQIMGEVQLEVLQNLIEERYGMHVGFSEGKISYKETIAEPVVGSGHFEPLRHYAEVHLLLEPGEPGSGVVFDTRCSEDVLDRNWQRLILTHLQEKPHLGVLTGSPVTDIRITLLAGRAHLKHTEGGDFRQATYRAVRQGLKKAKSVLLEPWYEFRLEVPTETVGRAMADIQQMGGEFDPPKPAGDMSLISGKAPVAAMKNYMVEVNSFTKGCGRLFCSVRGYEPCNNQEEVIAAIGYDSEADTENTADSVFCSHGAGVTVKWDQVDSHLHLDSGWRPETAGGGQKRQEQRTGGSGRSSYTGTAAEDAELEQIFKQTYGEGKRREVLPAQRIVPRTEKVKIMDTKLQEEYLLVDGYNIIFAWKELNELAKVSLDASREALIEILSNYQGYKKCHVVAVFDAYRVSGGERSVEKYENIDVVYTKEAETADMYIEKVTYEIGRDYYVRVATSDRLQQMIILGNGAYKVSADDFKLEVEHANAEISRILEEYNRKSRLESRNTIKLPQK